MKTYKMDLHVHTPASKCFKGEKTEKQYLDILRAAVNKKVDIIAITDHNSISGYLELMNLRERKELQKSTLLPYANGSGDIDKKIQEIDEILELYKKVWIIPGVEVTLNPGVHILVLSAPQKAKELSHMLDELGYTEEVRGMDSELLSSMDVKGFFSCSFLDDKIVIAPHVDSENGIYNELKGTYRADIFKSPNICAITCNSIKTKEKIQNLVKNDPYYRRDKAWVYINASDAHKVEDIGNRVSYVKLEKRKFDLLKDAFENSIDKISDIKNPKVQELVTTLCKSQKTICISDLNDNIDEFANIVCAYLNSTFHSLLIGVSDTLEIKGISIEISKMEKMFLELENMFNDSKNVKLIMSPHELGNGRVVYIIVKKTERADFYYLKERDEAYIFDKKVKKAKINDIQRIVKNNVIKELEKFQLHNDETIRYIQTNLESIKNPIDRYQMVCNIEKRSKYLKEIGHVELGYVSEFIGKWINMDIGVGISNGRIIYAMNNDVRLDDAVLRYSSIRVEESCFEENEISKMQPIDRTSIIITEKGGIYLVEEEDKELYIDGDTNYLIYSINEALKDNINLYVLFAWLKSSVFIWYIYTKYSVKSIFDPEIYNQSIFPEKVVFSNESEIEKIVKKIIEMEKIFLDRINEIEQDENKMSDDEKDKMIDDINKAIDVHNNEISEYAKQIDDIFLNELGFSIKHRNILVNDLNAMDIFNYLSVDVIEYY